MRKFIMTNSWRILLIRVALVLLFTTAIIACGTETLKTVTPLPTTTIASDFDKYIGLVNPDIPSGYEQQGFYSVDHTDLEYYVTVLARGNTRVLWLEKVSGYAQGESWKVLAVLVLNDFKDNAINIGNCYMDDKPDPEIIAPSDYYREGEIFKTELKQAWRANKKEMRFEPISPTGIKCESLMHFSP